MNEVLIAPSVLSLDYADTRAQIEALNQSQASWLHFDVMDGNFVPNISFGPDILKAFSKSSPLFKDVHLMIEKPQHYIEDFVKAGADLITFHVESQKDLAACQRLIDQIHALNVKAGISIKPGTDVKEIEPLLGLVDLVLVMSVEPGFGGQRFLPEMLEKVKWLREKQKEQDQPYLIEIDGGINQKTGKEAREAGVDVLVAGSYVFSGEIAKKVESLLQ